MPCEGCSVQFTVFRRKRCCADCKRFYCSNCLTSSSSTVNRNGPLCERCAIFARRPLLKVDLLQLKPKDLIFYLQSKHISTAGCVEKDELVGLVLNHIQQADRLYTSSTRNSFSSSEGHDNTNNNSSRNFDSSNSLDALKQTCQNFFSNISEKVDAFSFDSSKPTQTNNKPQQTNNSRSSTSSSNLSNAHITEQPRVSTREIPTYASFQHRQTETPTDAPQQSTFPPTAASNRNTAPQSSKCAPPTTSNTTPNAQLNICSSSSSSTCSPVVSLESNSPSQFAPTETEVSRDVLVQDQDSLSLCTPLDCLRSDAKIIHESISGCDCSDDEIITTFRARTSMTIRGESRLLSPQSSSSLENPVAGPSGGSSNVLTSTSTGTKKSSPSLKIESYDESSESSFEELGAIGGISDDSKAAADSSAQTSEQWQFVENDVLSTADTCGTVVEQHESIGASGEKSVPLTVAVMQQASQAQSQIIRPLPITIRPKKVARRRSDGYLNRRRPRSDDDDSPTSPKPLVIAAGAAQSLREEDEADNEKDCEDGKDVEVDENMLLMQDNRFNCKRCGKNRTNIKKHVEKMKRHLENSQMSEVDIKRELEEFLVYLEKRTKSFDCSDSETTAASSISGTRETSRHLPLPLPSLSTSSQLYDENEGIHVYASSAGYQAAMFNTRFINLEDFETLDELENLSVKQLKEVLMLNRVDYKGCCEKQELFDRVVRLWKNLKSTPAIEKLQTDELCKICMDAPIECVILECGHMATCTSCGKVLSECPICRQYIVRVVRFFKA